MMADLNLSDGQADGSGSGYVPRSHGLIGADDRRILRDIIFVGGIGLRWCAQPRECHAVRTMLPEARSFS